MDTLKDRGGLSETEGKIVGYKFNRCVEIDMVLKEFAGWIKRAQW